MSERPRRSTRTSGFSSPAQTPAPATHSTPASRLIQHHGHGGPSASASTSALPQYQLGGPMMTPGTAASGGPGGFGGGGSLIQAGTALLSQNFPGFQASQHHPQQQHPHQHQHSHLGALHQPQMHQAPAHHLPAAWTVSRSSAPVPPFTPLAPPPHPSAYSSSLSSASSSRVVQPVPQALYTTFPSRMRQGVTTLMQPIQPSELYDSLGRPLDPLSTPLNEARHDYGTPGGSANPHRASARASKRRAAAGFVRYVEADDSADDFEEEGGDADEPRGTKRRFMSPGGGGGGDAGKQPDDGDDEFKSFLGLPPPGNKVIARRMYRPSAHLYHAEEELLKQASRNEVLVPIRIELETDSHRIKDTFTWNMNEKLITPYQFARLLLEDLDLPLEPYATQIQNMIVQQVDDAIGVADIEMEPAAGGIWSSARLEAKEGELALTDAEKAQYDPDEEEVKEARQWDWGLSRSDPQQKEWRRRMQKRLKTGEALGQIEDDLRVIVDYEVQILRHSLRDRLEWDLCSPLTPESFATQLCKDLGLTGEAMSLISNSVREQLINHKRAALELGLLGTGRVLREKQEEAERCAREIAQERAERMRRKLEEAAAGTGTGGSDTPRTEDGKELEPPAEVDADVQARDGDTLVAASTPAAEDGRAATTPAPPTADGTPLPASGPSNDNADTPRPSRDADDDETSEVETLQLTATATATATAAPTREPSSTPAPVPVPSLRTSSRLQAAKSNEPHPSDPPPPSLVPKQSATQRLQAASYTMREILAKGPRPLEGVWRDFGESREFGPLLERLTDEDLEKLEEANVRASRRNRREAQRGYTASGRRRR